MDRDEQKRTRAETLAYTELLIQLEQNQRFTQQALLKLDQIPNEWFEMDQISPVAPHKDKLTLRLDGDMVRWFRKLCRGYQGRINAVLRAYMLAILSKEIRTRRDRDWKGDPI